MSKRNVEVFTGGCFLCDETVALVKELACPNCEVAVYDLCEPCESGECIEKSKAYGITSVPAVVVDGKIVSCCLREKPSRESLRAAGVGRPLSL